MKKFLVLYKASPEAFDRMMKSATPEQQKEGMQAWMGWMTSAKASLVDMGAPLGKATQVTTKGTSSTRNDLGGYSIMQGESPEEIAALLKSNPHFQMPDATIEITEIMPTPGM